MSGATGSTARQWPRSRSRIPAEPAPACGGTSSIRTWASGRSSAHGLRQPVTSCCNPRGCDGFFTPRFARRAARRYREKGVDKTARRMIEFLERRGIEGASVLEVGGGVGQIQIELLKKGAARAVNLELSPAYDEEAARLLREAGLEAQAERRLHDIAADPEGVEPADVVVLHRVVCCYPDYDRLLGSAAAHARRLLVFSHPPRNGVSRILI